MEPLHWGKALDVAPHRVCQPEECFRKDGVGAGAAKVGIEKSSVISAGNGQPECALDEWMSNFKK